MGARDVGVMTEGDLFKRIWRFAPQFQSKVWGGERLRALFYEENGAVPEQCGESWLLSAEPEAPSKTLFSHGTSASTKAWTLLELMRQNPKALLGHRLYAQHHTHFPLLIKLIHASQPLSIQVHPDDALAQKRHQALGKSECWYIWEADPNASLTLGFKQNTTLGEYRKALNANRLADILHTETPQKGDLFYVPAGCIHSIGGGIVLLEIQQSHQITYRIEDFGRSQSKRPLHRQEAEEALDWRAKVGTVSRNPAVLEPNKGYLRLETPHFAVREYRLTRPLEGHTKGEACVIYACVSGGIQWHEHDAFCAGIRGGEVALVPANMGAYTLTPNGNTTLLEITIP